MTSAAESANQSAKDVARSRPVKVGARFGILSYGITHLLIGWLALQVAFGGGGQQANQSGAFQTLVQQPFGRALLWVLAVGFVATALWRLEQAVWGYHYVSDRTTMVRRKVSSAVKVVVFLALALSGQATLWMAVFADMGASLLVVFNGLRLLPRREPGSSVAP